jgi:preprotein translocase subunit YajC
MDLHVMNLGEMLPLLLAQTSAPVGGAAPPPPGMDTQFFVFIGLIMVAFYFVILRPQRKEQLERQQAVDALKKGDRVMTTGGIYGTIQELNKEEGICILQVDKNVRLTIARSAITPIPPPKEAAASPAAAPAKT